ncbi:MAG: S8 family serine peptidase [candidate division KSB1 bacterium]|nr:S8 family serine peptidase [candidate division KSB1 bacterium]
MHRARTRQGGNFGIPSGALVVSLLCTAFLLTREAQAQLQVEEVLCRLRNVINPQRLPKAGVLTGYARLDEVLSRFQVAQVERIPAFDIVGRGDVPPLVKFGFRGPVDFDSLSTALLEAGVVEYVSPNHVYRLTYIPNDSAFYAQWVPQKLRLPQVWDRVRGSPEVVVGIIDTGVDPYHPDLVDAIWVNPGEDLNGDGRFSPDDLNGRDDDANGLVDDVWGWDFVDAPRLPDAGDYRTPDNEPMDEHGHGTAVAGIIGATGNNRIGIAGVAHGSKLMILRAGTARGYLEEDDVAAAIFYAVDKGARIVNMSFGDTEEAPFLRDVVVYAYRQGVTLVASAGNSGDDTPHFPAALSETFSVGATSESDEVAPFSSASETIDFVAPGVSVLSTSLGGGYERFTGTSASAPVVSGICALLLAAEPSLQPEQLRARLAASAKDIWLPGWDRRSGAGRVDPWNALDLRHELYAQLQKPCSQCAVGEMHEAIVGTASGPGFVSYALLLGPAGVSDQWDTLASSTRRVVDDVLATWQPGLLPEGSYVLRLVVKGFDEVRLEDRVPILIDRSAPVISDLQTEALYDAQWPAVLISFRTSDPAHAAVEWRVPEEAIWETMALPYVGIDHHALLRRQGWSPELEYRVLARNDRGLAGAHPPGDEGLRYRFEAETLATDWLTETLPPLPAGFLCPAPTDVNGNGRPEVAVTPQTAQGWGKLQVYEWDGAAWQLVGTTDRPWLARDAADVNGDGRLELLVGWGPQSGLLAFSPAERKLREIWTYEDDFWAARFVDFDRDGVPEIAARWRGEWSLWEKNWDSGFTFVLHLPNRSPGDNAWGAPSLGHGDSDGDGRSEIAFADEDGDLMVYESNGDAPPTLIFQHRAPLGGSSGFVGMADLDGDGLDELIVGGHSTEAVNYEHQFDTRRWIYRVLRFVPGQGYELWREWHFLGYLDDQGFQSHLGFAPLDPNGPRDALIGSAPDLYVVHFESGLGGPTPVAHLPDVSSNASPVADYDGDGLPEMALGCRGQTRFFQRSDLSISPPAPLRARAVAQDERSVQLSWEPVRSAHRYEVVRQDNGSPDTLALVPTPSFTDTSVSPGVTYRYCVRAIDASGRASPWTMTNLVSPHRPPRLAGGEQEGESSIWIRFTEPMGIECLDPSHYLAYEDGGTECLLSSVARGPKLNEVLLSFRIPFVRPKKLQVVVRDLADSSGTPLRPNPDTLAVAVSASQSAPYVVEALRLSPTELLLRFSEPIRTDELEDPSNYRILPSGRVVRAEAQEEGRAVLLTLSKEATLLPLGKTYRVEVGNVHSRSGVRIRAGIGDRVDLRFEAMDLSEMVVYPNPWRPDIGTGTITFGGLPRGTEVTILDSSGRTLRRLRVDREGGGVSWNLTSESGEPVAAGIYLFLVRNDREQRVGKFAVVR